MAEMTLSGDDKPSAPTVPGAKSYNMLPAVTPLALEIATALLGGPKSPSIDIFVEKLFPRMRERVRQDTGVSVPGVSMRDSSDIGQDEYVIMIEEIPQVVGTAYRDKVFVQTANGNPSQLSWPYSHAAEGSGFPPEGEWREPDKAGNGRGRQRSKVLDHHEYVTAHLEFMVRQNVVKFFGLQEVHNTLGEWLETGLPADAAQHIVGVREDYRLLRRTTSQLQGLLEDRVPLTQPERVAAGLRAAHGIADPVECRRLLREPVREQLWGNDEAYEYLRLSDSIEAMLKANSLRGERFALSPEGLGEFFNALRTRLAEIGKRPALVTSEERLRFFVRYLVRAEWPEVPVLASYELLPARSHDSLPEISVE